MIPELQISHFPKSQFFHPFGVRYCPPLLYLTTCSGSSLKKPTQRWNFSSLSSQKCLTAPTQLLMNSIRICVNITLPLFNLNFRKREHVTYQIKSDQIDCMKCNRAYSFGKLTSIPKNRALFSPSLKINFFAIN